VLSRVERIGDSMSLRRKLNPIARRFGFYTAYVLDTREFVGKLPNAPVWWQTHGYESNPSIAGIPLSAAKIHPETNETHDISVRKVDPETPRKQWHVHGWVFEDRIEIASHYEFRPDPVLIGDEYPTDMIERLRTHYRPEYGSEYRMGVVDPALEKLL